MVEFAIDKQLKKKIELMIKRVIDEDDNDNYLIIEGDTGSGKTNMSIGICHEVSKATGRTFDNSRIFFDVDKAVDFAKRTKEQIIIFDEPAFGGLKSEWRKKTQINLVKLLYTARMKRHFIVFNLVKFSKFNDDIIEKAVALIKIYKRDESRRERRFLYIPHKNIPSLLDYWHRKHIRAYKKFAILRGTVFRYVLPEIIDKELYNREKDNAILSIGVDDDKESNQTKKVKKLQSGIYKLMKEKKLSREELSKYLGFHVDTISEWKNIDEKELESLGEESKKGELAELIIHKG